MSVRLHSAQVIAKRKIFETIINPGFYIALALSLFTSYFLINGFVHSIDSSGFNFALNPLYGALSKTLAGAFGDAMIEKLFLEGPFLLVLYIYLLPVLIFLSFIVDTSAGRGLSYPAPYRWEFLVVGLAAGFYALGRTLLRTAGEDDDE